jgi:hypothetical protein
MRRLAPAHVFRTSCSHASPPAVQGDQLQAANLGPFRPGRQSQVPDH